LAVKDSAGADLKVCEAGKTPRSIGASAHRANRCAPSGRNSSAAAITTAVADITAEHTCSFGGCNLDRMDYLPLDYMWPEASTSGLLSQGKSHQNRIPLQASSRKRWPQARRLPICHSDPALAGEVRSQDSAGVHRTPETGEFASSGSSPQKQIPRRSSRPPRNDRID
jgi:hypothetical protein